MHLAHGRNTLVRAGRPVPLHLHGTSRFPVCCSCTTAFQVLLHQPQPKEIVFAIDKFSVVEISPPPPDVSRFCLSRLFRMRESSDCNW